MIETPRVSPPGAISPSLDGRSRHTRRNLGSHLAALFHLAPKFNISPLQRLGLYREDGQSAHFDSVTGPLSGKEGNVYFIIHGWAPEFRDKLDTAKLPLAWDSSLGYDNSWAYALCSSISKADPSATIFFFSWLDWSATYYPWISVSHTDNAGIQLAKAIKAALLNFAKPHIHLLGHSHGARVATVAAVKIDPHPAHLTLFDSPEWKLHFAANKLYTPCYLQALLPSRSGGGTFVDNYYSMFGVCYNNQEVPILGCIVDVRLMATNCRGLRWDLRHSYPMRFYQRVIETPSPDAHLPPFLNGPFGNISPDYKQTWEAGNEFAMKSGTSCFGAPALMGEHRFKPRAALRQVFLFVIHLGLLGRATVRDGRLSLETNSNAAAWFSFTKEEHDDAILFNYRFESPGQGDEFAIWVDDFRLITLPAPDILDEGTSEWTQGTVAVGIDQFMNGSHSLTLVLYDGGATNTGETNRENQHARVSVTFPPIKLVAELGEAATSGPEG